MSYRRVLIVVSAMFMTLVLTAGAASAFFCYPTNRSAQGTAKAGSNSPAWLLLGDLAAEELEAEGLCADGITHVLDGLGDAGLRDLAIHGRTVLAQGIFRAGQFHLSADGKGVDHLTDADFELFEELVDEAFGLCA